MICWTTNGALAGGSARPDEVSVATPGRPAWPLAASSRLTSASDTGSGSGPEGGPTLTTPELSVPDAEGAATPAAGSTACGCACKAGEFGTGGLPWRFCETLCPHPAQRTAAASDVAK